MQASQHRHGGQPRGLERARATLGEISAAMEDSFNRYGTQPTPVKGVYSAPYEGDSRYAQVVEGVAAVGRRLHNPAGCCV